MTRSELVVHVVSRRQPPAALQNRSHASYVEPTLKMWERELNPSQLLARVTASQIDAVKLRRAAKVERSTVDKDLGVLKAFFNWCIDRGLAAANPVRKVKFFHANNERVRYLKDEEWERLRAAALKHDDRSHLVDKMVRFLPLFAAPWCTERARKGQRLRRPSAVAGFPCQHCQAALNRSHSGR